MGKYSLASSKRWRSSRCAYCVFAVLMIIIFTSEVSSSYIYEQKLNAFQKKLKTFMQDMKVLESTACPDIVTRKDWNAKPPKERQDMKTSVPFVIIHHTAGNECFDFEKCCAEMRGIQHYHQDVRGWSDIGYNYLVGEDGLVYEGRNWTTIGTHAPWYNNQSIGISIMGNFMNKVPNDAAILAVQRLIDCALINGKLQPDYILYGHRQVRATECPGDALFNLIQAWPHWKPGKHFPPKP